MLKLGDDKPKEEMSPTARTQGLETLVRNVYPIGFYSGSSEQRMVLPLTDEGRKVFTFKKHTADTQTNHEVFRGNLGKSA